MISRDLTVSFNTSAGLNPVVATFFAELQEDPKQSLRTIFSLELYSVHYCHLYEQITLKVPALIYIVLMTGLF